MELSRRNFIAASGIAGAATAGASMLAATSSAHAAETAATVATGGNAPEAWNYECDVLVLGAGCSGLMAAYKAAEQGAQVTVLESQESVQTSSSYYCMGNFLVVGSNEQAAMGIEDSPQNLIDDIVAFSCTPEYPSAETTYSPDVVQRFAEHTRDAYDVLKGFGLEFPDPIAATGNNTVRCHALDNRHMVDLLAENAQAAGAEIVFNTEFTQLVLNGDDMVLGAYAKDPDGNTVAYKARKATILATGPFMRNTTMMEECLPGSSQVDVICGLGAYGAGHIAAQQIGAPMWGRNKIWCCEGYDPAGTLTYCELVGFGGIVVNRNGDRFVDEGNHWNNARTRALIDQGINPDTGTYFNYCVIDQAMFDTAMEIGTPLGLTEAHIPLLVEGATIEELAEKLGAPNLPATVEKYNEDLADGGDTVFGRTWCNGPGTGEPIPLTEPPFYAWPNRPAFMLAPAVGFLTNADMQLLDNYGNPLGGDRLYALGELVCRSITGNEYVVGSAISFGTTMGLLTGEKVASLDSWE